MINKERKCIIQKKAEEVILQYLNKECIPIDIEKIIEFGLGMQLIIYFDLENKIEKSAFISVFDKTVYVDSNTFKFNPNRYRFSLAHELGHFILHKEYFDKFNNEVKNKEEKIKYWKEFIKEIEREENLEQEANIFANYLLVPENQLNNEINKCLEQKEKEEKAKEYFKKLDIVNKIGKVEILKKIIASNLVSIFEVNQPVLEIAINQYINKFK